MTNMRGLLTFLSVLLINMPLMAQEQAEAADAAVTAAPGNMLMNIVIVVFIVAALVLLAVALVLLHTFRVLTRELHHPSPLRLAVSEKALEYEDWAEQQKSKPGFLSRLLGLKPIAEEKELIMEHKFDGIEELDNPTPSWFMWLFYATIFFAGAYLLNYHVFKWGKLQDEEYVVEMKEAEKAKEAYLAQAANRIDESNVEESKDAAVVSAGAKIFNANCVACHGDKGQGIVGPNLTDEYWLHGGGVKNVFKTVKYGVPDKGMISWEKTLTPKQIAEVANFILSLKGSNPAGAKAPQGEKEG